MLAFLLIVLAPAVILFTFVPVVLFGLMRETIAERSPVAPTAARREAFSIRDRADFALHDACVPSSA